MSLIALSACGSDDEGSVPASTSVEVTSTSAFTEPTSTEHDATSTTSTTVAALAAPIVLTGDDQLDTTLLELARFVEAQRGAPFLEPVDVRFLDDAEFETLVLAGLDGISVVIALRTQQQLLQALGLLPLGTDLVELVRASEREGVIGLYQPSSGELWVRGTDATPLVRVTIVHELVHAWDDQWFHLESMDADDADAQFAVSALAEGSARWFEDVYRDQMSPAEIAAAADEAREFWAQYEMPDWPTSVIELSESVYTLGRSFVQRLVSTGGVAALDAAFRRPPRSTEQLMHPDRYLADHSPIGVDAPIVAGDVLADGVMGEWALVELFNAQLAPSDARAAAEGWAGDRYVLTEDGVGGECVTMLIVTDTERDGDELALAAQRWAARAAHATADRIDSTTVRLITCSV